MSMCDDEELFAMKVRGFLNAVEYEENLKASGADRRLFFMWFTEEERERLLTEYEHHLDSEEEVDYV